MARDTMRQSAADEETTMYRLHASADTASLIVRLVLNELDLPYQVHELDRAGGELVTDAYRALHPLGKIPALETPDGPMFETAAILLYLSDRHPGLAPAPTDADRAAFLKWFFFTSTYIHPTLMQIFYPARVAGEAAVAAVLTHASARMADYLTQIDRAATANPGGLSSDRPSLLGYYLAVLLRWLGDSAADAPGHVEASDYPALHRILKYLEKRPASLAAAGAEGLRPPIFTHGR